MSIVEKNNDGRKLRLPLAIISYSVNKIVVTLRSCKKPMRNSTNGKKVERGKMWMWQKGRIEKEIRFCGELKNPIPNPES